MSPSPHIAPTIALNKPTGLKFGNPVQKVEACPAQPHELDKSVFKPTDTHKTLSKRARSKFYTQKLVAPLLYLDSPLSKMYLRAYSCGGTIELKGGKMVSKYCNSRICHVCNRIRTAKMMLGYIQPLRELGNLHFTTLTQPNVKAQELPAAVEKMIKSLNDIIRVLNERRKLKVAGIKKIEITYNQKADTYHPHTHLLHNKDVGEMIISEWLKRNPTAKKQGWDKKTKSMVDLQVTKPVTHKGDEKGYLNEIFKYATKLAIKDDEDRGLINVYVPALDNIMRALHRKHSVHAFGGLRMVKDTEIDAALELIAQPLEMEMEQELTANKVEKRWVWRSIHDIFDWIDAEGNRLTNYQPPDIEFRYFIGDASPPTKKELSQMTQKNKTLKNNNGKTTKAH
jgi:hypothetical protein